MRIALGVIIVVAGACRDNSSERAGTAAALTPSSASVAALTKQSGARDSAMWEDSSCDVDTSVDHPNAGILIRQYLARNDSLGFFAGGGDANDQWLFGAEECPGHAGGTDRAAVVRAYSIDSLPAGRDSARYVVRYDLVGSITPETDHMRFIPRADLVQDTIVLIKTPYGWRITGDPGDPNMSPAAVARQSNLDRVSLRLLDSTIRGAVPGSRPAPNDR